MATSMGVDTTDTSVIWAPGDTSGHFVSGATAAIPESKFVVQTATAAPTAAPSGNRVVLVSDDLYYWDGDEWFGPYVLAT